MGDALADGKLRTKTALVLAASWPDETKEIQMIPETDQNVTTQLVGNGE